MSILLHFAGPRQVASTFPFTTPDFHTIARCSICLGRMVDFCGCQIVSRRPQNYVVWSKNWHFYQSPDATNCLLG